MKQVCYGIVGKENRYVPVYKRPSVLSQVLTYLYPGDIVIIDDSESTSCYYKIKSDSGADGFCIQTTIDRKDEGYGP